MSQQTPDPFHPPTPQPGEVPSPVRDVPPNQPSDPVFPPVREPGVDPDGPRGPQRDPDHH